MPVIFDVYVRCGSTNSAVLDGISTATVAAGASGTCAPIAGVSPRGVGSAVAPGGRFTWMHG